MVASHAFTLCRDKSVIVWDLTREGDNNYGYAKRRLTGHSHFVEDVVISSDGLFALSGSWDGTLRLWNLKTGATERRFLGHTKDVLSVAFSVDNRQVQHFTSPFPLACKSFTHLASVLVQILGLCHTFNTVALEVNHFIKIGIKKS